MTVFCELILKLELCKVTKLVRSVSAKSCLEHCEVLKGLHLQTALTGLPWISARALPDSSPSCWIREPKKSVIVKQSSKAELQK